MDGKILCAHCNCMAGLGKSCSHMGALLFALKAVMKIRKFQTVGVEKVYPFLPSSENKVKFVQQIAFTSARTKKHRHNQS